MEKTDHKDRHTLSYFNLLDALDSENCPICALTDEESKTHLRSLYYEFVNDALVRDALHHSKGFCNGHAWASMDIPCTDTGISIIYNDLIQSEIASMREILTLLKDPGKKRRPFSGRQRQKTLDMVIQSWETHDPCIVCASEARATMFYLREFIDHFHEKPFAEKFQSSPGLCLPHLRILVRKFSHHPNLPSLLECEIEKCHTLSWELGEFWRKHDYRFSHEPKGPETDSWRRVIRKFVGMREHFGNDVMEALPQPPRESPTRRFIQAIRDRLKNPGPSKKARSTSQTARADISNPFSHEMTRALKQPGCPVCRVGEAAQETYLFWLLKQNYDAPAEVAKIHESEGFCREHAAWIASRGPDYANTILSERLATRLRGALEAFAQSLERNPSRRRLSTAQNMLRPRGPCPACLAGERAEATIIRAMIALLNGSNHEKGRELYESSDGLCARHLSQAIQEAPAALALYLARDMTRRLDTLTSELRTSLKNTDYRHHDAGSGDATKPWRRAFTRLFGNVDGDGE